MSSAKQKTLRFTPMLNLGSVENQSKTIALMNKNIATGMSLEDALSSAVNEEVWR